MTANMNHDKLCRISGLLGLVLLLGLTAWLDHRFSSHHDHSDPSQHRRDVTGKALDGRDSAGGVSGQVVGDLREVVFEAYKYVFAPDPLVVRAGERVRLKVKSRDVEHGMIIPEVNLSSPMPLGKHKKLEFTAPAKPGRYPIFCSVFCGSGHGSMKGTLIVLPGASVTPGVEKNTNDHGHAKGDEGHGH